MGGRKSRGAIGGENWTLVNHCNVETLYATNQIMNDFVIHSDFIKNSILKLYNLHLHFENLCDILWNKSLHWNSNIRGILLSDIPTPLGLSSLNDLFICSIFTQITSCLQNTRKSFTSPKHIDNVFILTSANQVL